MKRPQLLCRIRADVMPLRILMLTIFVLLAILVPVPWLSCNPASTRRPSCRSDWALRGGKCVHVRPRHRPQRQRVKRRPPTLTPIVLQTKTAVPWTKTMHDARTGITWVSIRGGTFSMGSNSGNSNEKPIHRVRMKNFQMAKTEVTVAQYAKCVRAGKCTQPKMGKYCNWGKPRRANHPINCVCWYEAKDYAAWARARLPSEAEWEYAARSGGKQWEYPWGNLKATCTHAVLRERSGYGCGWNRTWPVCGKTRGNTTHGLCDMAGNVFEWVEDRYHSTYHGAPRNGSAWVSGRGGKARVLRGGGWYYHSGLCRASARIWAFPDNRFYSFGFRLLRSIP